MELLCAQPAGGKKQSHEVEGELILPGQSSYPTCRPPGDSVCPRPG